MSHLADLINELCPDGVEYKPLSECVVLPSIPRGLKRGQYESSGTYPIVDQGRGQVAGYSSDETKLVKDIPGIVFGDHTREIKYVDHFFVPGADGVKWIRAVDDVDIRYLFHSLSSLAIPSRGYNRHWNVVREMSIPVPPLEVQREIVRILDQFTTLEARRAQYEYYRNQLLSYDALVSRCPNGVEYKSIGSFSKCVAGATPNSKNPSLWDGDIPWMSSGEVNKKTVYSTNRFITQLGFDSCSTKMVPAGAVVIALAGQGKTRGTVARIRIELCTNQSLCAIITDKTVDSDYLFHYLSGQYDNLRAVSSGDGTRGGLNLKMIRAYKVPVPPIEEQRRIADVLDRFDTLVNDISSGLPAEIAARRAQYEYYRDRLLSFPEKK
jgi:hypothetical protein